MAAAGLAIAGIIPYPGIYYGIAVGYIPDINPAAVAFVGKIPQSYQAYVAKAVGATVEAIVGVVETCPAT